MLVFKMKREKEEQEMMKMDVTLLVNAVNLI
jgi:hypothetical protein